MPSITIAGREVLVDVCDLPLASEKGWTIRMSGNTAYVQRVVTRDGQYAGVELLHRLLVGCDRGVNVDHINGNGLDNRRVNLRSCSQAENTRNRKRHSNNKSGFKGVYLAVARSGAVRWRAQIRVCGEKIHLGLHDSAESAYRAYCEASRRYHGEFSRTA